jgi:hypothetical protein
MIRVMFGWGVLVACLSIIIYFFVMLGLGLGTGKGGVNGGLSGFLDTDGVQGIVGAFSTYPMIEAYNGNIIEVSISSTSTTTINVKANANKTDVNRDQISAFLQANPGRLISFYDQAENLPVWKVPGSSSDYGINAPMISAGGQNPHPLYEDGGKISPYYNIKPDGTGRAQNARRIMDFAGSVPNSAKCVLIVFRPVDWQSFMRVYSTSNTNTNRVNIIYNSTSTGGLFLTPNSPPSFLNGNQVTLGEIGSFFTTYGNRGVLALTGDIDFNPARLGNDLNSFSFNSGFFGAIQAIVYLSDDSEENILLAMKSINRRLKIY